MSSAIKRSNGYRHVHQRRGGLVISPDLVFVFFSWNSISPSIPFISALTETEVLMTLRFFSNRLPKSSEVWCEPVKSCFGTNEFIISFDEYNLFRMYVTSLGCPVQCKTVTSYVVIIVSMQSECSSSSSSIA